MKILIVAQQFFPDSVGGSARVAFEQARTLANMGHTVFAIVPKTDLHSPYEEKRDLINIVRYGNGKPHILGQSYTDVRCAPAVIKKVINTYRFDVILAHQPTVTHAILSLQITIPIVYMFHASVPREISFQGLTGKGAWKKLFTRGFVLWLSFMERKSLEHAKRIVVLSEYSRELALSVYSNIQSEKISRITTGIQTDIYTPPSSKKIVRARLGIPEDCVVLITVRRLVPRMGLSQLIESCASIIRSRQNVRLYIVGDGPLYESLQKQIEQEGLGDLIILTGRVRQDDLPLWYQSADAFILSTRAYEGLGVATLEALSSGIPVLGTPIGATPEILGQIDSRLLFDSADSSDMRKGIEWFLSEGINDHALRMKMRQLVLHSYTWELAGAQLEKILEEVVDGTHQHSTQQQLELIDINRK